MNDNLRELVLETYKQCEKKTYGWQRNPEEFRTKFAELIIRECIRHFNEDYQRDFDTLWREDLTNSIKNHFGIE